MEWGKGEEKKRNRHGAKNAGPVVDNRVDSAFPRGGGKAGTGPTFETCRRRDWGRLPSS